MKDNTMAKLFEDRVVTLGLTILVVCVTAGIVWPDTFLTFDNLSQVMLNISVDAIVAIGMMLLLISGVFDLSVGSVVSLSGGVTAYLLHYYGMFPVPAILCGLGAAGVVGLINGVMVAKAGVNPMIQTLGMLGVVRGVALMISGAGIQNLPGDFNIIGQARILGVQSPVIIMIVLVALFHILVSGSSFFRRYYYIGGNEKAAILSGIRVNQMKILAFVITSLLAGVAGILLASRFGAAMGTSGRGLELRVITAVILGGASLLGGEGKIAGAFLGTVFMGVINNIMIIGRVSGYWQEIILGAILIIAVWLDIEAKKRSGIPFSFFRKKVMVNTQ